MMALLINYADGFKTAFLLQMYLFFNVVKCYIPGYILNLYVYMETKFRVSLVSIHFNGNFECWYITVI